MIGLLPAAENAKLFVVVVIVTGGVSRVAALNHAQVRAGARPAA